MTISVQRAGTPSVAVNNPNGVSYIKGSEFVDGSMRFIVSENEAGIHLERRTNGDWNEFLFRLSEHLVYSNSLEIVLDNSLHPVFANKG